MQIISVLLIAALAASSCHGGKVLLVHFAFPSHMLVLHRIGKELLEHGHEVTTLLDSQDPKADKLQKQGFKVISYHWPQNEMTWRDKEFARAILMGTLEGGDIIKHPSQLAMNTCDFMMDDKEANSRITAEKFDVALVDYFPISFCNSLVPYVHGIPFINVAAALDDHVMGNPNLPSYSAPPIFPYTSKMSFGQRLVSAGFGLLKHFPALSPFPAHKNLTLLHKYVEDSNIHDWTDLTRKASLFLVSRAWIADAPMATFPHCIAIEGLTAEEAKPLPDDLAKLIALAPHGFVLVSFGSNVEFLPDYITSKLLSVFGKRKELIIWRFKKSVDSKMVVPPNVKLMSWLPQNDLMGQGNLRLFITHGGNNGLYEALYHGIPLLAFPLFGDQQHNGAMVQDKGYGLVSSITEFTEAELLHKMDAIIDNTTYRDNTRKAAEMMRSASMSGPKTAVHWTEHVMKFGGDHLRPPIMDMPGYQYWMVDIFALVGLLLIVLSSVLYFLIKLALNKMNTKPKEKTL